MMVQHTVTRNAQQPVPKPPATDVEPVEPFEGQEPDLLADVFRGVLVSTKQVIDHSKDVAYMALVHDGPRRSVAPGHLPQQEAFVVHRSTALVVWFPLPVYCRERSKSFAICKKFAERREPAEVVARLLADQTLNEPLRRAALRAVMRRAQQFTP